MGYKYEMCMRCKNVNNHNLSNECEDCIGDNFESMTHDAVLGEDRPDTKIELNSRSLGMLRTSATYILALLQLESDKYSQLSIIADVAEKLGITGNEIQEIQDDYMCPIC